MFRKSVVAALALSVVVAPGWAAAGAADGSGAAAAHSSAKRDASGDRAGRSVEGTVDPARRQLAADFARKTRGSGDARVGAATTAAAAPVTTPTLTAPADGAAVSGLVPVQATSTAPAVRFSAPDSGWSEDVAVVNGTASAVFDSFGSTGSTTLTAADCDAPAGECGATDQVTVTVDNGAFALTQPADGSTVGTSYVVAASSTGGLVRFFVDGNEVGDVSASPYQLTVSAADFPELFGDGSHVVYAVQCDGAGLSCPRSTAERTVVVKTALEPTLRAAPLRFSPNSDGLYDTTTFTYSVESTQTVKLRVTNSSGTTLRGPINLGTKTAGTYKYVYNGRDNAGKVLPSRGYVARLETVGTVGQSQLNGLATASTIVDLVKPSGSAGAAYPGTVYPSRDGYRDSVLLSVSLSEAIASARVEVFNAGGRKVRTLTMGARAKGRISASFNGRTASGTALPGGTYSFRYVLRDLARNDGVTRSWPVTISPKRLVERSGTKTFSPESSYIEALIGYCSEVVTPAQPGWTGSFAYLSNYYACYDPAAEDEIAITRHSVVLPTAVRYGPIRLSTYGGRDLPGYEDSGAVLYEIPGGDLSDFGADLGPAVTWHPGDAVSGESFVSDRRFRWWAGTTLGNYYDIKTFKVAYVYYILI